MTVAWVLGSTGLLGSALCRALRCRETALFSPAERFRWGSEPELALQMAAAVGAFAARVGRIEPRPDRDHVFSLSLHNMPERPDVEFFERRRMTYAMVDLR